VGAAVGADGAPVSLGGWMGRVPIDATADGRDAPSRPAARARQLLPLLVVLLVAAAACTADEEPAPDPPPDAEAEEASPGGARVGVVLPSLDRTTPEVLEVSRAQLAELEEDRVGDIAAVRTVVPDGDVFAGDLAALLADDGYDLVCLFGAAGSRTVLDLADRFPSTRFCSIGARPDDGPDNVDLFELGHEELGATLGAVAATLAGDGTVGLVRGDDRSDRADRRRGALASLAASDVVLDVVLGEDQASSELVDVATEADPDVVVVDAEDALATEVLDTLDALAVGPVALDEEATGPAVRWELRLDAVVDASVTRLLDDDAVVPARLGLGDGVFQVVIDDELPQAASTTFTSVRDAIAAGDRDPVAPVPDPEQQTGTGDTAPDGADVDDAGEDAS
jgi:hypothetical protein